MIQAQAQQFLSCLPFPTTNPGECCPDLFRFVKGDVFDSCKNECTTLDKCFKPRCIGVTDGNFDSNTALTVLNKFFAGDENWISVGFISNFCNKFFKKAFFKVANQAVQACTARGMTHCWIDFKEMFKK